MQCIEIRLGEWFDHYLIFYHIFLLSILEFADILECAVVVNQIYRAVL